MPFSISDAWKPLVREHVCSLTGESRDTLSAKDFSASQSVIIRFPDGSHVLFRHAFVVKDESRSLIGVFTEHCGYHEFPAGDAELDIVRSVF